ncbi:FHA domain-containing protein [Streptomyces sp. NPDC006422]|uniref:FHA domain-containing protein n=1 Tax=unclassified Streptomyces TaxID=2593676 RepID=UPI0033BFB130
MPTCPNGHQSGSDDWCEVCGHRMAGAVPPPPPPPPPASGYGYPQPPAPQAPQGGAGTPELCPQCRTPREGGAPFCEECRWNFLTNTATSYTPAAPNPPLPTSGGQGGPGGPSGPGAPGFPGQQEPQGPNPALRFQQQPGPDSYEYQGSRPSQINRPAEPIPSPSFDGPGANETGGAPHGFQQQAPAPAPAPPGPPAQPGPPPGQPGPPQGPHGQPGPPPGPHGQPGPPQGPAQPVQPGPMQPPPPGFPQHQDPQGPPPPPADPSFGGGGTGGDDWMLSPPSDPQGGPSTTPPPFQQQPPQPQGPVTWSATIGPDRDYFMAMMQRSGPEASGLNLPAYSPEQQRQLTGNQLSIGRRRHSTGESPDIDLSVPPEDPGVSHQHAVLVQQPDGTWAVVDQNSTNGTTVNGGDEPIQPFVPVPLQDGDRVHVGAWTTITIRRG